MFANPSKFAHVVVAGLDYRVNVADKAEIFTSKLTPRLQAEAVGEMLLTRISMGKLGRKSLR